eukprot:tig00020824_g14236.t1
MPDLSARPPLRPPRPPEFNPEPGTYDVIWIQWVIGHLTDEDMVAFLKRCQRALRPEGWIVVKARPVPPPPPPTSFPLPPPPRPDSPSPPPLSPTPRPDRGQG